MFSANMNIPRVSSDNAATPEAQDLVESLKDPPKNATFSKINDKHHIERINLAE